MLLDFKTIDMVNVRGKRVLLREDLNVPTKEGNILDYKRINEALATIRYLSDHGARVLVVSHLGRPNGKRELKYTLKPVAHALSERLAIDVAFAVDTVGPAAHEAAKDLRDGGIVVLENVRFEPGEEQNDPVFARQLAQLADIYCNDAFGTAHRAHASTEGVAHYLPSYAGFVMQEEIENLSKVVERPAHPYVCAIGGAKVHDKVGVFSALMNNVDTFCIGGGMANTFLAANGVDVGRSLRDADLEPAKAMLELAAARGVRMLLPVDAVVSPSFDDDDAAQTVDLAEVGDRMILDIGPKTGEMYAKTIENAKTVIFNGPMGVYEKPAYREGTKAIGEALHIATSKNLATTIVGGGDAAAAAEMLKFSEYVTYVSTGGGATLEFLEGKNLPGIAALEEAAKRLKEDARW